jgi:aryl-alcohol dehydrogenase-like predicted oxidoreductase
MTTIGSSSLDVFPLALGGNTFGWTSDEETSVAVLDAFTASGGDFVDTADVYSAWAPGNGGGESETILGRWMTARGNRDQLVIGTKVSQHPEFPGLSAANIRAAAAASLTRLGTDRIDLYWAHFDDAATPLEETVAAFDALVTAGTVRYVGLSNYSAARVSEWIDIATRTGAALPVALQPHYNLVHRRQYEAELAPVVEANGLGVVPYYGLASGFLTGKYRSSQDAEGKARGGAVAEYLTDAGFALIAALDEIAAAHDTTVTAAGLAWLESRPGVVAPIASARTPEQLPELMASASVTLTTEELATLDEVSARVEG